MKSSPRDPTSHHVLGVIFTEIGRLQQGERHYRRALELLNLEFRAGGSPGREADSALDRETGTMLANLAWNLKLQGRLEDAAASYERALELRPDNARAIGGYAQVEAARGNKPHAATLLDDAVTRWPADRSLRLLRALTDLALNDPDAVLTRLNDPPEALLPAELTARGRAFERLGQTSEALTAYATAKACSATAMGSATKPRPGPKRPEDTKHSSPPANSPYCPAPVSRKRHSRFFLWASQVPARRCSNNFSPTSPASPRRMSWHPSPTSPPRSNSPIIRTAWPTR